MTAPGAGGTLSFAADIRRFTGPCLGDLPAGVLATGLIADDDHDLPAPARELPGGLESQTAASTRDDDDLVPDRLLRRRRSPATSRAGLPSRAACGLLAWQARLGRCL